jgi:hypothetical protein
LEDDSGDRSGRAQATHSPNAMGWCHADNVAEGVCQGPFVRQTGLDCFLRRARVRGSPAASRRFFRLPGGDEPSADLCRPAQRRDLASRSPSCGSSSRASAAYECVGQR